MCAGRIVHQLFSVPCQFGCDFRAIRTYTDLSSDQFLKSVFSYVNFLLDFRNDQRPMANSKKWRKDSIDGTIVANKLFI